MTPRDFCYWLQGMFELTGAKNISRRQLTVIREHLDLVLKEQSEETKVTPEDDFFIPIT